MSDETAPHGASGAAVEQRYPNVIRAVRETPWAILPGKLAEIVSMLAERSAGHRLSDEEIRARVGGRDPRRDLQIVGSTAVIPVYGVISGRADMLSDMSGGTSVQRLQSLLRDAVADPEITGIVFDIDSPGGSTDLLTEVASQIRGARGSKPIVSVANTRAASAAYWIGSQADEFVVTPSGDVGSIGVFAAHDDLSGLQEKMGVKTTLISAGEFKTEGNPFEPLSEEARQALQDQVDEFYGMFVSDVAQGRRVSVQTVKDEFGKGRMVTARQAVTAGMVDRVDTLESVVSKLQNPSGRARVRGSSGARVVSVGNWTYTSPSSVVSAPVILVGAGTSAGPIKPHSTATTDTPWDGPQAKANLSTDNSASYRQAFAWFDSNAPDPDGDGYPDRKGDYKFIHHEVSSSGDVGAANLNGCSQGIAVLNGSRGGTTIPSADRQGVYDHLAQHLRDGGKEPPPLKSEDHMRLFADDVDEALRALEAVVDRAETLRVLTGTKREQLATLIERGQAMLDADDQRQADELTDPGIDAEFDRLTARLNL